MFRVKCSLNFLSNICFRSQVSGRSYLSPCVKCAPLEGAGWRVEHIRHVSFFNRQSGDNLWDAVTGVSNAGKKRGRGKRVGRKRVTNLNKGQIIGTGRANMMWPGLNADVTTGTSKTRIKKLPENPNYLADLAKMRQSSVKITRTADPPLLRGWSGGWSAGKSVGPPEPVNDFTFEGFDSNILQVRMVANVTGTLGKKFTYSSFVVVGNKNGLAGFGQGKATTANAAIRIAKSRAAKNLMFIPRYEEHTVYHNMFSQFHRSKIFIHKKRKGYGLKCHRAIKTCCEQIGITDLHVKVQGNTKNIQAVVKGFFQALVNQESHQELAERMRLHVVETRPERGHFPQVIASPAQVREEPVKSDAPYMDEKLNWLYYGDKTEYKRPPQKPFYANNPSYKRKKIWLQENRNQPQAQMLRRAGLW